ncbi:hypothetical protein BH11PSE7_BH11PSE7_32550 [soil metagenome]
MLGAETFELSPAEFNAFIAQQMPRYERVTQNFGKLD